MRGLPNLTESTRNQNRAISREHEDTRVCSYEGPGKGNGGGSSANQLKEKVSLRSGVGIRTVLSIGTTGDILEIDAGKLSVGRTNDPMKIAAGADWVPNRLAGGEGELE